jgi:membrane-bound serine protease (ClpP class)
VIWAFVLLVLGTALAVSEVFFVSLGVLALASGLCLLGAAAIAFGESAAWGWSFVAGEVLLVPLAVRAAFQVLPRLPFGRRMILSGPATLPVPAVPGYQHLVGQTGRALTDLRPSGTAEIGAEGEGERLSVVSLTGLVPRGAAVTVVAVEGTEIRVRPTSPGTGEPPAVPASPSPARPTPS